MALHIHSDASYLSATHARSRIGGYFCLTNCLSDPIWAPSPDSPPLALNGPIHVNSTILRMVVASVAEAELGALFTTQKMPPCSARPWKKWATHRWQCSSRLTTHLPQASPMPLSNSGNPKPLTCAFTGSVITSRMANSWFIGNKDAIMMQIISRNITHRRITVPCALATYTSPPPTGDCSEGVLISVRGLTPVHPPVSLNHRYCNHQLGHCARLSAARPSASSRHPIPITLPIISNNIGYQLDFTWSCLVLIKSYY